MASNAFKTLAKEYVIGIATKLGKHHLLDDVAKIADNIPEAERTSARILSDLQSKNPAAFTNLQQVLTAVTEDAAKKGLSKNDAWNQFKEVLPKELHNRDARKAINEVAGESTGAKNTVEEAITVIHTRGKAIELAPTPPDASAQSLQKQIRDAATKIENATDQKNPGRPLWSYIPLSGKVASWLGSTATQTPSINKSQTIGAHVETLLIATHSPAYERLPLLSGRMGSPREVIEALENGWRVDKENLDKLKDIKKTESLDSFLTRTSKTIGSFSTSVGKGALLLGAGGFAIVEAGKWLYSYPMNDDWFGMTKEERQTKNTIYTTLGLDYANIVPAAFEKFTGDTSTDASDDFMFAQIANEGGFFGNKDFVKHTKNILGVDLSDPKLETPNGYIPLDKDDPVAYQTFLYTVASKLKNKNTPGEKIVDGKEQGYAQDAYDAYIAGFAKNIGVPKLENGKEKRQQIFDYVEKNMEESITTTLKEQSAAGEKARNQLLYKYYGRDFHINDSNDLILGFEKYKTTNKSRAEQLMVAAYIADLSKGGDHPATVAALMDATSLKKLTGTVNTSIKEATVAAAANYTGVTPEIFDYVNQGRQGRNKVEEFKESSNTITRPMSSETFEINLKTVERFGFLNKYANKDELMSQMRSTFAKAVTSGGTSVSAENMETVIDDIETKLNQSGVQERDARKVKEMLLDNPAP